MLVAKQVADLITLGRAMLAVLFVGLGMTQGAQGLPWAAWLLLLSWSSDLLDGAVARRSRVYYHTWIGDHDLQVDMAASAGLLVYLTLSGFIPLAACLAYVSAWALAYWRWRSTPALGMLFQAPIYAGLIALALLLATPHGLVMLAWIAAAIYITWPRFPQQVIPGFLQDMRSLWGRHSHHPG